MNKQTVRTFFHRAGLFFGVPVGIITAAVCAAHYWRPDPIMSYLGVVLYGPVAGWAVVGLFDGAGWVAASLFKDDKDMYPLPWHDSNFDFFANVMKDRPKDELIGNFLARRWSFRISLLIAGIVGWAAGRFLESVIYPSGWSVISKWHTAVVLATTLASFGTALFVLYFTVADMIFALMGRLRHFDYREKR